MIIYQVTNNWCNDKDITRKDKFLYFSQYYPTKAQAQAIKTPGTQVWEINLVNLGREEIAKILSMDHVSFEHSNLAGGYHEVHDIKHLTKNRGLIT